MAAEDDRSKKLEQIQKRLAEIQAKSSPPASKSKTPKREEAKKDKVDAPKPAAKKASPPAAKAETKPTPKAAAKKESPKPEAEKATAKAEKPMPKVEKSAAKADKPSPTRTAPKPAQEVKPVAKKKDPIEKEVPKVTPKGSTDQGNTWSGNTMKEAAAKKVVTDKNEVVKPKKQSGKLLSKIFTLVSVLITLTILSYLGYTYFYHESATSTEVVSSEIPEEVIESEMQGETADDNVEVMPESNEEISAQEDSEPAPEIEEDIAEPVQEPIREEKPVASSPQQSSGPVPSGFIISYASNSNEGTARNNVAMLKSKGFSANYYYMPDKSASSPSLYKVYVGPYQSESEALPDFKKVVGLNDKAFILRMN